MAGIDRKSKFPKIVLLAMLLAVQVLGHAHAVDHALEGDNTLCSICSVTGHGGSAIVDSGETQAVATLSQTAPACPDQAIPGSAGHRHHARAPPLS